MELKSTDEDRVLRRTESVNICKAPRMVLVWYTVCHRHHRRHYYYYYYYCCYRFGQKIEMPLDIQLYLAQVLLTLQGQCGEIMIDMKGSGKLFVYPPVCPSELQRP